MLEGTKRALEELDMECKSSVAKDENGREYPVLLMEYRNTPIALIDWRNSVVLRVEIKMTDDLRKLLMALPPEEFDELITEVNMELNLGRCAHDLAMEGNDLSLITIEQKLLVYPDRPETVQRLLDGINEVTNVFQRTIMTLYAMLQITEEGDTERSSPAGMFG
jgi:hypothetical protein